MLRGGASGAKIIYLERGWTRDRNDCAQLDMSGTGGLASWAEEDLEFVPGGSIPINDAGDLLVVLRYERRGRETDNVRDLSPYFPNNLSWLHHLRDSSRLPVRLRPHPETKGVMNRDLNILASECGWVWDSSCSFEQAAVGAKAVAVIDSTAGVWAMELGLPVLCWGRQVYRHLGVVHCMTNDRGETRSVTNHLSQGITSIDKGAVSAMLDRIRAKQWYAKDALAFPRRLQMEFGL